MRRLFGVGEGPRKVYNGSASWDSALVLESMPNIGWPNQKSNLLQRPLHLVIVSSNSVRNIRNCKLL